MMESSESRGIIAPSSGICLNTGKQVEAGTTLLAHHLGVWEDRFSNQAAFIMQQRGSQDCGEKQILGGVAAGLWGVA